MSSLQYPGIRLQQFTDEKARAAMKEVDGHLRALYDVVNAMTSTDHGKGLQRVIKPVVVPEVSVSPLLQSTYGHVGELRRVGPDVYMKTGRDAEDTDWVDIPTGAIIFATPTALVGLSAIPGGLSTFMRSDAAPALNQGIVPIWTGAHTFQARTTHEAGITALSTAANQFYLGYNATNRMEFDTTSAGATTILLASGTTSTHRLTLQPTGNAMAAGSNAATFRILDFSGNQRFFVGRNIGPSALNHVVRIGFDASNYLQFSNGTAAGADHTISITASSGTPKLVLPLTSCVDFTPTLLRSGLNVSPAAAGTPGFDYDTGATRSTGVYFLNYKDFGASIFSVFKNAAGYLFRTDSDFMLGAAGNGFLLKEGTNATMGIATLVAGTVVVNTTKVTANSRIFLTRQTVGGTPGTSVDVTARTAGTSFTITAQGSILDTSTVAWLIVEPA